MNSEMPAGAGRRAVDARQHEMNDVLGQIVLAGGDENLGAGDLVAAVGLRRGAGAHQAEIGAALRLGQVHGAGPLPGDELRQIKRLLLRRPWVSSAAIAPWVRPGYMANAMFAEQRNSLTRLRQHHRQALAAELGGRRYADPAAGVSFR